MHPQVFPELNDLILQAITSCYSGTSGCSDCSTCGGYPQYGFQYVQLNGGLASNSTYPFVGYTNSLPLNTDTCDPTLDSEVKVAFWVKLTLCMCVLRCVCVCVVKEAVRGR